MTWADRAYLGFRRAAKTSAAARRLVAPSVQVNIADKSTQANVGRRASRVFWWRGQVSAIRRSLERQICPYRGEAVSAPKGGSAYSHPPSSGTQCSTIAKW